MVHSCACLQTSSCCVQKEQCENEEKQKLITLNNSHGAAALGYGHPGCLQLSHVRTADPSADGCRSAASRTAIDGGQFDLFYTIAHNLLEMFYPDCTVTITSRDPPYITGYIKSLSLIHI